MMIGYSYDINLSTRHRLEMLGMKRNMRLKELYSTTELKRYLIGSSQV
jgi:hypothetical protein